MIAYVVINENTVMLPVTFPVAHIMTIDVCTVVNDLDYLETLSNEALSCKTLGVLASYPA